MTGLRFAAAALAACLALAPAAGPAEATEEGAALVDEVARIVERHFYDRGLAGVDWKAASERHRTAAREAADRRGDLEAANALLSELRVSHTFLIPAEVYERTYDSEMRGRATSQFGFMLERRGTRFFVSDLLAGGAADRAGLRRGDEVVSLDGAGPAAAPRLVAFHDRGTGAAARYELDPSDGKPIAVELRRAEGQATATVEVAAGETNRVLASAASIRTIRRDGLRFGYARLYHVLHRDCYRALEQALMGPLASADGLILDLRGWGGYWDPVGRSVVRLVSGVGSPWRGRVVAIVDENTRSAKEVMAYHLRKRGIPLVGRRTAGAVLGAGFYPTTVASAVVVLAVRDVRSLTDGVNLEGAGVEPDVPVDDALPYAGGEDELVEAACRDLEARLAGARLR